MVNRPSLPRSVLRTVVAVTAATAATAALTACGSVNVGTAARVGGDRITTVRLDETVADWRREFQRDPAAERIQQMAQQQASAGGGQAIPFDLDSPRRSALYQLIDYRIWDRVGRDAGITVSKGQIDAFVAKNGGRRAITSSILARDVPARHTDDVLRAELIQRELFKRAGFDVENASAQPDQAEQARRQQAIRQLVTQYVKAAKDLDIEVNPRFGAFDPQQVTIKPVSFTLSKHEEGTEGAGGSEETGGTGGTGGAEGTGESGAGAESGS